MKLSVPKSLSGNLSLLFGLASFIVVYFVFAPYFWQAGRANISYGVIGPLAVWIAAMASFACVFSTFILKVKTGNQIERDHWWILAPVLGAGYAFAVAMLAQFATRIFGHAFRNMTYDFVGAPFLLASFAGIVAYYVTESVREFNRRKFAYLITIQFLAGLFYAATINKDNYWWRGSICSLGMPVNGYPITFNFMLVLTGVLMATFAFYLGPTMASLVKKNIIGESQNKILTTIYIFQAALIILAGLLPYGLGDSLNRIHIMIGDLIFEIFGMILLLNPWLFPKFPQTFKAASYFLLFLGFSFFAIHSYANYFTIAVMELMMLALVFVWLTIFVRTIMTLDTDPE